ncbi:MAG: VWA domain-containing protein [Gemmatimonas sp.]
MGFLAPALLGLGLFAGVPLLVHLLRRRVGRTVDFPAVRYLERMEQEHSRELKLRHRVLLLLRILAVLALALAAARPIARLAGLGHAPLALAVVLDNSMSTSAVSDGRAVFDDLRDEARTLVQSLTVDDRGWIVTADGRVVGGTNAALLTSIDAMRPLGGRGDLAGAIRRAAALTASGAPRSRAVALVTDGQANGIANANDSVTSVGNVPLFALVHTRGAVRNRAVVAAKAEPARWTPTGVVTFAIASPDSAPWRVTLDGRTVARGTAGAGSVHAPARIAQRLGSSTSGWVRGSVETDADELRGDDARWFAVRVAPPPQVAVRGEAGPFLGTALATLVEEKRLARGAEGSAGTVTVAGANATGVRLPVLLTAPADPISVGEANRTLARLRIPWRFGGIARDLVLTRSAAVRDARGTLDSAVTSEAARRGGNALNEVPVRLRYPLIPSAGGAASLAADTLAMAGGAPWAVAGPDYVLIASPLEPDATDLPLRAAFVPWLLDALSRRLGNDGRVIEAHPGENLTGFDGVSALERPDGTVVSLSSDRLTVPNDAGVYFLRRQATRSGALVVNPEPEESDLGAPADQGREMLSHIAGRLVTRETDGAVWRRKVLATAVGRSLLPPMLMIALAALLMEAWFARDRGATKGNAARVRGHVRTAPSTRAA